MLLASIQATVEVLQAANERVVLLEDGLCFFDLRHGLFGVVLDPAEMGSDIAVDLFHRRAAIDIEQRIAEIFTCERVFVADNQCAGRNRFK
ncbi:hypothetical protein D3C81_2000570 [compost metagenome]